MDKIWIIFEREYLQRVKKKSFLIGTLLTPLIFPLFIGITIFFLSSDDEKKRIISCVDYNSLIVDSIGFDNNIKYLFFVGKNKSKISCIKFKNWCLITLKVCYACPKSGTSTVVMCV